MKHTIKIKDTDGVYYFRLKDVQGFGVMGKQIVVSLEYKDCPAVLNFTTKQEAIEVMETLNHDLATYLAGCHNEQ